MGEHYEMVIIYNRVIRSKADIEELKELLERAGEVQVIVEKWETKGGKNEEALEADIRHSQGIKETN